MFLCVEALLRGRFDLMHRSARKLIDTGFLTETMLAYGRWMMRVLPENSILITNGDMDTLPLLALQAAEGFRTDVAVVEKQWLGLGVYLHYLRDHHGVSPPLEESQIDSLLEGSDSPRNIFLLADHVFRGLVAKRASGGLARPLTLAVTTDESFFVEEKEHLQYAGPFLLWRPTPTGNTPDTTSLRNSLEGVHLEEFTGPWVSDRDRSPVRRLYTKQLAGNITFAAVTYGEVLIDAGDFEGAKRTLSWAEDFDKATESGPAYGDRISELKARISQGYH
jgi:hypothetical protein